MAKTLNLRPGHGRRNRAAARKALAPATITLPAQPTARDDHYTWAVNAAVESGQLDLADDLAASYARGA